MVSYSYNSESVTSFLSSFLFPSIPWEDGRSAPSMSSYIYHQQQESSQIPDFPLL